MVTVRNAESSARWERLLRGGALHCESRKSRSFIQSPENFHSFVQNPDNHCFPLQNLIQNEMARLLNDAPVHERASAAMLQMIYSDTCLQTVDFVGMFKSRISIDLRDSDGEKFFVSMRRCRAEIDSRPFERVLDILASSGKIADGHQINRRPELP
jgi:hypothetical protein